MAVLAGEKIGDAPAPLPHQHAHWTATLPAEFEDCRISPEAD
jgi:hypothetical protein